MDCIRNAEIYERIEQAILYIQRNKTRKVTLPEMAAAAGISEYHFHRQFTQWAGTTPERFFKYLKKEYILSRLNTCSLTEATYAAGLSNPSRLHDLCVTYEAMSPGELKTGGGGTVIRYGLHPSPFGLCFIALTRRGILALRFAGSGYSKGECEDSLRLEFGRAEIREDSCITKKIVEDIFGCGSPGIVSGSEAGAMAGGDGRMRPFHLLLHGTNFQIKVWEALLSIPPGSVTTYGRIAEAVGRPSAARGIGNAVGRNPVAYLIPCHRVINAMGVVGNYRWGSARKAAILGWELSHAEGAGSGE